MTLDQLRREEARIIAAYERAHGPFGSLFVDHGLDPASRGAEPADAMDQVEEGQ